MDQKVFFDIVGSGSARDIVDIEVGNGGGDDLHIFVVDGIMYQSQIEVSHFQHLLVPV